MPIYEYQCSACGQDFEIIQKMSDPVLVDCPNCEQPELRKLISRVAFRLKGSGWYETDFKTDKKRNVVDSERGEASSTETAGEAPKESAPSSKKDDSSTESSKSATNSSGSSNSDSKSKSGTDDA